MALPPSTPPSTQAPPSTAPIGFTTAKPKATPPRIVVNAVEGWGKTTLAAHIEDVAIIQVRGETGYATLVNAGLVPERPHANVETWDEVNTLIDQLIDNPGDIKAVAIDALGGLERLCHEHVCNRDFKGDFGEKGFGSYMRGYDLAVTDWLLFLAKLDKLRDTQGVMIILLSHVTVKTHKNPMGQDFDRYVADVHHKTWGATHKWADAIIFGTFNTFVENDSKKGNKPKGVKGTRRIGYTERTDAYDAKNRYGMDDEIDFPDDPAKMWETIRPFFKQ